MSSGDYDYLNARVRGMASQMLTVETYEQVLAAEGENLLVDVLLGSPYAPELREALTVHQGKAAVESALRRNLHATLAKVLSMAPSRPRELLSIQLNLWDAANVVTLVRGKVKGAQPEDIMSGITPVGEYSEPQLAELAATPDVESLADELTTWGYRFSFEVRRAILASGDRNDLPALESAVSAVYFDWACRQLPAGDPNAAIVRKMIEMQLDLANLRVALHTVRHRMHGEEIDDRFAPIPGGLLGPRLLNEIAGCATLVDAFEVLADTYFAPGVDKGILAFGRAQSLGVMERFLEVVVIAEGCRLFRRDPLSVAVPLGFLWRKYNEFVNLRILVRGKAYKVPANAIRKEMLIA